MSDTTQTWVDRLFREQGGRLRGGIRAKVRNRVDVDDLYHDVYLKMRSIPDTTTIKNPEGYLFTVARNLLFEYFDEKRRQRDDTDVDDLLVETELVEMPDFFKQIETERRMKELREVLLEMPARWLAAVKMCHIDGMSYEEAAQKLGVSINSIKKYLKKALAYCRYRMLDSE
jgi:RNA polymerase sigma-70 factor (ECF subfamily)